ncbi:hypothetical protein Hanom_Chr15g01383071 [Helianthus anomalus]
MLSCRFLSNTMSMSILSRKVKLMGNNFLLTMICKLIGLTPLVEVCNLF